MVTDTAKLTALQTELKALEKRSQQLAMDIGQLSNTIDEMKPQKNDVTSEILKTMTSFAKRNPLTSKRLHTLSLVEKKEYMASLAQLVLQSSVSHESAMLYLCRRAVGAQAVADAEELYEQAYAFDFSKMDEWSQTIEPYKYVYLTDAFVMALLLEQGREAFVRRIVDLATLLSCDAQDIYVISEVAKSVVTQFYDNLDDMYVEEPNRYAGKFDDFIPQQWIEQRRELCCSPGVTKESLRYRENFLGIISGSRYETKTVPDSMRIYIMCNDKQSIKKGQQIGYFQSGETIKAMKNGVLVKSKNWLPKYLEGLSGDFYTPQWILDKEELLRVVEIVFNISIFDTIVNSDEELREWCDKTYSALYVDLRAKGIYDQRHGGNTLIGTGICYLREA